MTQLLTLFLTLLSIPSAYRMMVISDPHVLDSTLFDDNSASMQFVMSHDLKQNEYAQEAFIQLIDSALAITPNVVLIPGDMTMNGSCVDHNAVVHQLHRLTNANIPVCLIPGNHDINNSNAASYLEETPQSIPSINDVDFDSIYAFLNEDFPSRRQDPNSHSYVLTLAPRLTLIGVDCSRGDIDGLTLDWICSQADSAVAKGDRVIAMMHHQLLEPTDGYSTVLSDALVDDASNIAYLFRLHGIELVFTGHMHINNVTTNYIINRDSLVDISTGSPAMYPNSYRMLTASDTWGQFSCETNYITSLPSYPNLTTYAKQHVETTLQTKTLGSIYDTGWEYRDSVGSMIDKIPLNDTINNLLGLLGLSKSDIKELANDLIAVLPTDSIERTAYINSYIGSDAANAFIIYIEGNEGEKETESLKKNLIEDVYELLDNLIEQAYPGSLWKNPTNYYKRTSWQSKVETIYKIVSPYETAGILFRNLDVVINLKSTIQDALDSFFGDYTQYKKDGQNRTDDLRPNLRFTTLSHRDYYATVYYDLKDYGANFVDSVLINEPTTITRPQDPTFDGWTFVGWYTDNELTQEYDFNTVIDANDDVTMTLYAKWIPVLTFALGDVKKQYDGTPIDILYKYKGSLPKSCTPQVQVDTIITNVDSVTYHVTNTTIWKDDENVTANYTIEWLNNAANMVITPRAIEITTISDSMEYTGYPLVAHDTTIVGDGFVEGEGIEITFTGSQTEVGLSDNTMTYVANEGTNLSNYEIRVIYGLLTVTPQEVPTNLVSPSTVERIEKVWINNHLFIRKGEDIYDAKGARVE